MYEIAEGFGVAELPRGDNTRFGLVNLLTRFNFKRSNNWAQAEKWKQSVASNSPIVSKSGQLQDTWVLADFVQQGIDD